MNFEWSEHMHETDDLVLGAELGQHGDHARVDPAVLDVLDRRRRRARRSCSRSSASASAFGGPPVPAPSPPNCSGSIGFDGAGASTGGAPGAGRRGRRCRDALPSMRMNLTFAPPQSTARDGSTRSCVVALKRRELAVFDAAVHEPYVAVGAEVVPAAPVIGRDVPGRASSALTTVRPLLPCSALRTQVATPAQPGIPASCPPFPATRPGMTHTTGFPARPPPPPDTGQPAGPCSFRPREPRAGSARRAAPRHRSSLHPRPPDRPLPASTTGSIGVGATGATGAAGAAASSSAAAGVLGALARSPLAVSSWSW